MYEHSETGELARTVSPDLCCVIPAQRVHANVAVAIGYWYWYYTSHLGLGLGLGLALPPMLLLRTVHSTQAAMAMAMARFVFCGSHRGAGELGSSSKVRSGIRIPRARRT